MRQNAPDMLDEEYESLVLVLAINLKELALRQRVTCANAVDENFKYNIDFHDAYDMVRSSVTKVIMNAQIEEK